MTSIDLVYIHKEVYGHSLELVDVTTDNRLYHSKKRVLDTIADRLRLEYRTLAGQGYDIKTTVLQVPRGTIDGADRVAYPVVAGCVDVFDYIDLLNRVDKDGHVHTFGRRVDQAIVDGALSRPVDMSSPLSSPLPAHIYSKNDGPGISEVLSVCKDDEAKVLVDSWLSTPVRPWLSPVPLMKSLARGVYADADDALYAAHNSDTRVEGVAVVAGEEVEYTSLKGGNIRATFARTLEDLKTDRTTSRDSHNIISLYDTLDASLDVLAAPFSPTHPHVNQLERVSEATCADNKLERSTARFSHEYLRVFRRTIIYGYAILLR